MAYSSLLSLSVCFLVLFHGCFAQIEQVTSQGEQHQARQGQQRFQNECQLQKIYALEPDRKIKSEAGFTEIWDQNDDQLQCAGVVVVRHTFQPRGLLLPSFNNCPQLFYVVEGRGLHGASFPGCPETYQSSQSQSQGGQQLGDEHQKVQQFWEGEVIALPAGVAHWIYNNGPSQLVLVSLVDVGNFANQLDQNFRKFFLAGNPEQELQGSQGRSKGKGGQQQSQGNSLFGGFGEQILADSFNIDERLAKKLQSENDERGIIVQAKEDFQVLRPRSREQEQQGNERQRGRHNGLEETFCTMSLRQNINEPQRADVYNPRAGRITSVNSFNLPILKFLQLSAERGVLYRNGIYAPHWNINAHSIVYVTRGNGRVQIVDNFGEQLFDGQLQKGQLLVVPQGFAVVKKASNQGFEWIAFKTNENAKISQFAGRVSAIRSFPEEVVMHSYQISREEARKVKFNRQEATVFSPSSRSQQEE